MDREEEMEASVANVAASVASDLTASETPRQSEGWRPIATAPRDGSYVMLWLKSGRVITANSKIAKRPSNWPAGWDWPSEATHWQPLPSPPPSAEGRS